MKVKHVALLVVLLFVLLTSALTVIPVRAPVPGDVNGDNKVTIIDLCLIARAFGTIPGPQGTGWGQWNPSADLNNDAKVDIKDFYICAINYGTNVVALTPQPISSTHVRLLPTAQTVSISTPNFDVELKIKNVADLSQYEFTIEWDMGEISFNSASEGSVLSNVGPTLFVCSSIASNKMLIGCTLLVPNTASVGATFETLTDIKFTCTLQPATTTIQLVSNLYDTNMMDINHNDFDCHVTQTP